MNCITWRSCALPACTSAPRIEIHKLFSPRPRCLPRPMVACKAAGDFLLSLDYHERMLVIYLSGGQVKEEAEYADL